MNPVKGQLIYGFTPGHRGEDKRPYVYGFHFDHEDAHGNYWPVGDECILYKDSYGTPHYIAFEKWNCAETREEVTSMRDKWFTDWEAEQRLSDEEWVEKDYRKFLSHKYPPEIVDKYIAALKSKVDELWFTEITFQDGKLWYRVTKPPEPCKPIVENTRHREIRAEKEARLKRQAENFYKKWTVLEIE